MLLRTLALVGALLLLAGTAEAQEKVNVGVLEPSSFMVLFLGAAVRAVPE